MAKLTLNTIGSRYGSVDALNDNFDAIEQALENTFSLDGTSPNALEADLDMNGNDILNAGSVQTNSLVINGIPVVSGSVVNSTPYASFFYFATAGQTSFSVSPYTPSSASVKVKVNGLEYPSYSISTSGTNVIIPATQVADEVTIDVFVSQVDIVSAVVAYEFTSTAGQTTFTTGAAALSTNNVQVEVDGLALPPSGFTVSGSSVVLPATLAGQQIVVRAFINRVESGITAEEVSYIRTSTGAVARNQKQENDSRLTSKQFGIGSDKSASYNRGALQEAVNSGLGRLDIVANYAGETILIDGPIDVPTQMEIEGIGRWTCNVSSTNLSSPIFRFAAANNYNALRSLHLSYSGTPLSGANAIECNGNSYLDLFRVTISSCWNGVYLFGGVSGQAGNHELVGLRVFSYENTGVFVDSCLDVNLTNFRLAAFARPGALGGIRLLGGVEAFTASQGDITLGRYGLTCDTNTTGGRGNSPWFNKFSNVFFDSPLYNPAYLRYAAHTDFIGCWFASAGHDPADVGYTSLTNHAGIDMENCEHLSFIGGDVYGNGGNGINMFAGNKHISIDGVRFKRNGRWRSVDCSGVNILAGTTDFSVTNCTFQRDANTIEFRQRTGVNVNTGASDKYIVSTNKFGGCNLVDNGTGLDKVVNYNVGIA